MKQNSLRTILSWEKRPFYFDVLPESYEEDDEIYFRILEKLDPNYTIPVLSLKDDLDIIETANGIPKIGFAIRITSNDSEYIEDTLGEIINSFNTEFIDIILDMREINNNNYNEKFLVLKSIISDIPSIDTFRNIILSSSSFPENLSSVERYELAKVDRLDWNFWNKCTDKLNGKFDIKLIYSDYCVTNPNYVSYIPGMSPLFKIRYTFDSFFVILKGQTIKKGGLDSDNVSELCKTLVDSRYFKGEKYSWGDEYIYIHSNNNASSYGNLTTWVKVGINHHITFVIDQLSNLL